MGGGVSSQTGGVMSQEGRLVLADPWWGRWDRRRRLEDVGNRHNPSAKGSGERLRDLSWSL